MENWTRSRIYNHTLLFLTTSLIISKYVYIQSNKTFDIDILTKQLTPFKNIIKPNSVIGFEATNPELMRLYGPISFVMAPYIVSQYDKMDTVLALEDRRDMLRIPSGYKVISKSNEGKRIALLLSKNK